MIEQALVFISNEEVQTNSEIIAVYFGKRHSDVLRDIRNLDCSDIFRERNFALTSKIAVYGTVERENPYYKLTKDGFMFLCMGYTGEKAAEIKERYIDAFNKMHDALLDRQNNLQSQYNRAWLDYELASAKASDAGRALNILGKQVKPACKQQIDDIFKQMQPSLEYA